MPIANCSTDIVLALRKLFRAGGSSGVGIGLARRGAVDAPQANLIDEGGLGMVLAGPEDFDLRPDQTVEGGDVFVVLRIAEGPAALSVEGFLAAVEVERGQHSQSGRAGLEAAGLGLLLRFSLGLGLLGADATALGRTGTATFRAGDGLR